MAIVQPWMHTSFTAKLGQIQNFYQVIGSSETLISKNIVEQQCMHDNCMASSGCNKPIYIPTSHTYTNSLCSVTSTTYHFCLFNKLSNTGVKFPNTISSKKVILQYNTTCTEACCTYIAYHMALISSNPCWICLKDFSNFSSRMISFSSCLKRSYRVTIKHSLSYTITYPQVMYKLHTSITVVCDGDHVEYEVLCL